MSLKISPTPTDFQIVFPVRDTYKPGLKAGITITNIIEMMFAMGKEFGEVFDAQETTIAPRIFDAITQYIESTEQQNNQPVTGIQLSTRNSVIHAGIPEVCVDIWLFGGHGPPEQRTHLLPSNEYGPSLVGAVAHDFPDVPRALITSTSRSPAAELIPLTKYHTAKFLSPDEQIPPYIEQPIEEKIVYEESTRIVYPIPVLDEEKLRHPNPEVVNITSYSITQDVRNRLSDPEVFFIRFF